MLTINDINKIEWSQVEPEPLGGDLAEDLGKIINKFVRFSLNEWWKSKGFGKENKNEYLALKGPYDKMIRQSVYVAKTIAACVKFKFFDESEVRHKLFVARDRYMKLIRSCLYHHASNLKGGWGLNNEHLQVATELLFVCWLVWEKLNIRDQELAINLLDSEIQKAMEYQMNYNFNIDGSGTDMFECQTIENMNHANLLYLASVMIKNHTLSAELREKAILVYRACFSSKEDGDMQGYNVADDMLLYRFEQKSPFAISYIGVGIKAYIYSKIAGQELPSGVVRNFKQIYYAFYASSVGEDGRKVGMFTNYDKKNRPLGGVLYPDGVRAGRVNESALYAMDIFAYCLGYENLIEIPSREWAKARMKEIERNFKKNTKYTIQGCNQYRFLHGEAVCSQLADCYLALFLYLVAKKAENNFVDKFSREEYGQEPIQEN